MTRIAKSGFDTAPMPESRDKTLATVIKTEIPKWQKVVAAAGLKAD